MDAVKEMQRIAARSEVAALVVRELATFKTAQPSTDIYRRRVNIQKMSGKRFTREEVEEVFEEFHRRKWGRLTKARGSGEHGKFDWSPSFDYRETAQAALKGDTGRPVDRQPDALRQSPRTFTGGGPLVIFTLSSGQEIRLTPAEARELKGQLEHL